VAKPGYETVPQSELDDRVVWAPRAAVVGGCMTHNAFVVVRGSIAAYNEWGEKSPGWSWEDLQPHWKEVLDTFDLTVNDGSIPNPTDNQFHIATLVAACEEAGYTLNTEFNSVSGPHNGCNYRHHQGKVTLDASSGETFLLRQTAYHQFVHPILSARPNLDVVVNRRVHKVAIDKDTLVATGVYAEDPWSKTSFYYTARKDVILSAGVYDTPKLLMLSGIGPADHLDAMGMEVLVDSPGVGSRLVDDSFSQVTGPALTDQPAELNTIWGKRKKSTRPIIVNSYQIQSLTIIFPPFLAIDGIQMWGTPDQQGEQVVPDYNWNLAITPDFDNDGIICK
jgi:choline dehydrogenase